MGLESVGDGTEPLWSVTREHCAGSSNEKVRKAEELKTEESPSEL